MKMMTYFAVTLVTVGAALPALADDYSDYPAPIPHYPFRRSYRTDRFVAIPPYRRPFVVRVYTTPPQPPYYNVLPYAVAAPY